MANTDRPKGFVQVSGRAPTKYVAGGTFAKGDLVTDDGSGQPIILVPGTHSHALGVAASAGVSAATCYVYDDPTAVFVGQTSGSYSAGLRNDLVDIEGATGVQEINENASSNGTVVLLGTAPDLLSPTETGNWTRVRFRIAKHLLAPDSPGVIELTQFPATALFRTIDSYQAAAAGADRNDTSTGEVFHATTYTLAADALSVGDVIEYEAYGVCVSDNSTDTLTLKLYLGSLLIGSFPAHDAAAGDVFCMRGRASVSVAGASGKVDVSGIGHTDSAVASGPDIVLVSSALDTTAQHVIRASSTWSVSHADNQFDLRQLNVRLIQSA